jgi:hypothetical protein
MHAEASEHEETQEYRKAAHGDRECAYATFELAGCHRKVFSS